MRKSLQLGDPYHFMLKSMRIAIIGASGFIGSELTRLLLAETDHQLTLFSHRASKLRYDAEQEKRLRHVDGSVLNTADVDVVLSDADMVVYLVHLMGQGGDYNEREARAAETFGVAAHKHGVIRVVYVGGMADDDISGDIPGHLGSRRRTGEILRKHVPQLIELRTPMVIGEGGAGFDLLRKIVDHSPILPLPTWARGVTRPITVGDVARYISASLELDHDDHLSLAIGGPERLTYADIAKRYAATHGRRLYVLPVPFIPQQLVSRVLKILPGRATKVIADALASASYSVHDISNNSHISVRTSNIDGAL